MREEESVELAREFRKGIPGPGGRSEDDWWWRISWCCLEHFLSPPSGCLSAGQMPFPIASIGPTGLSSFQVGCWRLCWGREMAVRGRCPGFSAESALSSTCASVITIGIRSSLGLWVASLWATVRVLVCCVPVHVFGDWWTPPSDQNLTVLLRSFGGREVERATSEISCSQEILGISAHTLGLHTCPGVRDVPGRVLSSTWLN